MSESCESLAIADLVPTEIYFKIFKLLKIPELLKCRAVCSRWRNIIDDMCENQDFWVRHCITDYKESFEIARKKCREDVTPRHLYRSLSTWSKLNETEEDRDEFSPATSVTEEIRSFKILRNGMVGVHKRTAVVYYDIETLMPVRRDPIIGEYEKYSENDQVIALLNQNLFLFVIHKAEGMVPKLTCDYVKTFTLYEDRVYYVDLNDNLFMIKVDSTTTRNLIGHSNEGIISMGFKDEQLYVLTCERCIYTVKVDAIELTLAMNSSTNFLENLCKYNMLETLDWRLFFQWIFLVNRKFPQGLIHDIIVIRAYNEVIFVGTSWGVLRMYYRPYHLGQFDIFNSEPMKQYNFMERFDCPVLSMSPILDVDCMETQDGHKVLVAMPKKVVVLTYEHNFAKWPVSDPNVPKCVESKPMQVINVE